MNDVVIVAAARTAIGKFGGMLASMPAPDLGAVVIQAVLQRAGVAADCIDEIIFGQVLTAGAGQNPARQAAIKAGLPHTIPAFTINQVCGSGLKSVMLAATAIMAGEAEIVIAGGQENMSASPHVLPGSREGFRLGHTKMIDSMIIDGLWDVYNQYHMGITAENIAQAYHITRVMQDTFSVASQNKAEAAQRAHKFKDEIVPLHVPQRRGDALLFTDDEYIRTGATLASMAEIKPAFLKDGTVTAGNSSGLNDGAAAVLLMSSTAAAQLQLQPLARIAAFAQAGVDPKIMGTGPIPASQRCLAKAAWKVDDLDLIEVNEAFAAQALAVHQEMAWDVSKVNVNGGAIALGHPIGASGCRILVTLLYEMQRRAAQKGLASLCIGGGMGVALAVER